MIVEVERATFPSWPGLTRPSSLFLEISWMAGSGAGHEGREM